MRRVSTCQKNCNIIDLRGAQVNDRILALATCAQWISGGNIDMQIRVLLWPLEILDIYEVKHKQVSFKSEVGVRVDDLVFRLTLWWNVESLSICFC